MTATETPTVRTQADELFKQINQENSGIRRDLWHVEVQLAGVKAVSLVDDLLTLRARDERNLQALETWTKKPLERAASLIAQRDIRLEFTLNGHVEPPPPVEQPAPIAEPELAPAAEAEPLDPDTTTDALLNFDFFSEGGGGYVLFPHYAPKYTRPYLGDEAFDIWEYVRSQDKNAAAPWTEPREFRGSDLAAHVDCSAQKVTGVWRPCKIFDEAYFGNGEVLTVCCNQHAGEFTDARPSKSFPGGRPMCRHWVHGALEILQAEGLAVWEKIGTGPRNTYYTIQVYQRLPLLTPKQAERLPASIQSDHKRFFRVRGLYEVWMSYEPYYSMLALQMEENGLRLRKPGEGVFNALAHKRRNYIFFPFSLCANDSDS